MTAQAAFLVILCAIAIKEARKSDEVYRSYDVPTRGSSDTGESIFDKGHVIVLVWTDSTHVHFDATVCRAIRHGEADEPPAFQYLGGCPVLGHVVDRCSSCKRDEVGVGRLVVTDFLGFGGLRGGLGDGERCVGLFRGRITSGVRARLRGGDLGSDGHRLMIDMMRSGMSKVKTTEALSGSDTRGGLRGTALFCGALGTHRRYALIRIRRRC
jgi:hypothetical protein